MKSVTTLGQDDRAFHTWETTGTLASCGPEPGEAPTSTQDAGDPVEALTAIAGLPERSLIALPDLDALLADDSKRTPNIQLVRVVKTTSDNAERASKCLVVVGPRCTFPEELRPLFRVLPHALPAFDAPFTPACNSPAPTGSTPIRSP